MSQKNIAFVYSHGGPIFDSHMPEGLTIRGRNILHSITAAIRSGGNRVYISESVYPDKHGQIRQLIQQGRFGGAENKIDLAEYPVANGVPFPKNYLFNRGAQRASDCYGIIFSDSDVVYHEGFPNRALDVLDRCEFAQPDILIYLDPTGQYEQYRVDFDMKYATFNSGYHTGILYLPGRMPGMVNIARRESFLEIGGFSQAISGVNWEDMEYQFRLKMLKRSVNYIANESVMHIYHPRGSVTRKQEGTGIMYLENLNFLNWLIYFLQINGNNFNHDRFSYYVKLIKNSLDANQALHGPYTNITGSIIPQFNPNERYHTYFYGQAEPYSDGESKEIQCAAILNAADFWRLPVDEILHLNKHHNRIFSVTVQDVMEYKRNMEHTKNEEARRKAEEARRQEARRIEEEARKEEARIKEKEARDSIYALKEALNTAKEQRKQGVVSKSALQRSLRVAKRRRRK